MINWHNWRDYNLKKVIYHLLPITPNITLQNHRNLGCLEVVKHLIDNGADPNLKNKEGETALHGASLYGYLEVVKHLMANSADQKLTNKKGETALHKASYEGEHAIVKHLMVYGADHKLKDNNGKTAYDRAADENYKELMDFLLPLTK